MMKKLSPAINVYYKALMHKLPTNPLVFPHLDIPTQQLSAIIDMYILPSHYENLSEKMFSNFKVHNLTSYL